TPINIHLTGCPNSCAQHFIADLGLLACRVAAGPVSEDTVEGFHLFVGGGFGPDQAIGRELYRDVPADRCPVLLERILHAYLANRGDPQEIFRASARRHEVTAIKRRVAAKGAPP